MTWKRFLGIAPAPHNAPLEGAKPPSTGAPDVEAASQPALGLDAGAQLALLSRHASAPRPVAPPQAGYRALVAEQNPVTRRVLTRMLESLGFTVDLAPTAYAAIDEIQAIPYDVVLLDCDAASFGGSEAAAEIRLQEAMGRHVPLVALTACGNPQSRVPDAAQFDAVLTKPVTFESAASVLSRFCSTPALESTSRIHGLDRQAIATLHRLTGGEDQLAELVTLFVSTATRLIEDARIAINDVDHEGLAAIARSLRAASGQVGARRLEDLCATLEVLAGTGSLAGTADVMQEIGVAFQDARRDLQLQEVLRGDEFLRPGRDPARRVVSNEVLVAEADALVSRFLSSGLQGAGFRVTSVEGGIEASDLIARRPFGAILLDTDLAGMDGFALLDEIRLRSPYRDTPVIVISSRTQEHEKVRAFELGADDYVTKPFSPLELIARLQRLTRRG